MVAYSFKRRFVTPILVGLGLPYGQLAGFDDQPCPPETEHPLTPKLQTIRADRRRHARPGEELQLYCGMRTKECFLIGHAICTDVLDIVITFGPRPAISTTHGLDHVAYYAGVRLDYFARRDGFSSWSEMREFWATEHGDVDVFIGVMVCWLPLSSSEARDDVSEVGGKAGARSRPGA